jgi:hypothetical protein
LELAGGAFLQLPSPQLLGLNSFSVSIWIKPHFSQIPGTQFGVIQAFAGKTGFHLVSTWNIQSFDFKFCVDTVTTNGLTAPIISQHCVTSPSFSATEINTWLHVVATACTSKRTITISVRPKHSRSRRQDLLAGLVDGINSPKFTFYSDSVCASATSDSTLNGVPNPYVYPQNTLLNACVKIFEDQDLILFVKAVPCSGMLLLVSA